MNSAISVTHMGIISTSTPTISTSDQLPDDVVLEPIVLVLLGGGGLLAVVAIVMILKKRT